MTKLLDAIKKLDVGNDNHWTEGKEPRMDTIKMLAGDQSVTRDDVDAAAKGFNRDTAAGYFMTVPPAPAAPTPLVADVVVTPATPLAQAEDALAGVTATPLSEGAAAAPQAKEQADAPKGTESGQLPAPNLETEPLEVEGNDESEKDEVEALEAQLEKIQGAITDARGEVDAITDGINLLIADEAHVVNQLNILAPNKDTTQSAIQQYLASQRDALQARGERQKLIAESGLNLKELADNLQSPIDSAMARRTGRGGTRPQR